MKKLFAVLFLFSFAFAQVAVKNTDNFIPKTLTAGVEMSARAFADASDDTTQAFSCRGYHAVYVGLEGSTNDSVRAYLAYQISKDGTTYGAFTLLDSLAVTGTVGLANYIQLPAKCMGAYSVRLRVYGIAANGAQSINPAPKLKTYVVRVLNGSQKQN